MVDLTTSGGEWPVTDDDPLPLSRERSETVAQRIDRNWNELLQELRVTQTGVQILTGFLLILPFQARFDVLGPGEKVLYLWVVSLALIATVLLLTPVMLHRLLFRRHAKDVLLRVSTRLAVAGLFVLAAAVAGIVWIVWSVVAGPANSWWATGVVVATVAALWLLLPQLMRRKISTEPYS